jgi:hypothetical protein
VSITHLGQPPTQHVVLESIGVANTGDPRQDLDFFRVLPDASLTPSGPAGFRVPPGQVLVVTDADWQYNLGSPGGLQTLRCFIQNLNDPTIARRVFESTVVLDKDGQGGASEDMTAGFMVAATARITVDTSPGGGKISHVLLRGYLVREKTAAIHRSAG